MGFSIKENFKTIKWGATLGLHLMRCLSAALVWCVIVLIASGGQAGAAALQAFFVVPGVYFISLWMFLGVCKFMTHFVGGLADLIWTLVSLVAAFGIAIGDPLLFFLNRTKPGLLPVAKFNFVNFTCILWVLDPQKV